MKSSGHKGEKMMKALRWNNHENHREIIEEIYASCKYLLTEQAKDSLLDAIECMRMADKLDELSTIDIVHCSECKYCKNNECFFHSTTDAYVKCKYRGHLDGFFTKPDDFCSDGIRK